MESTERALEDRVAALETAVGPQTGSDLSTSEQAAALKAKLARAEAKCEGFAELMTE